MQETNQDFMVHVRSCCHVSSCSAIQNTKLMAYL